MTKSCIENTGVNLEVRRFSHPETVEIAITHPSYNQEQIYILGTEAVAEKNVNILP